MSDDCAIKSSTCESDKPAPKYRITPENAREMAAKGNVKRQELREAAKKREALLTQLLEKFATSNAITDANQDDFQGRVKKRVRAQIEMILGKIDKEKDPQKLDRLASAFERLAEIERKLDMRPAPANIKPTDLRRGRRDLPQPLPPTTPQ